MVERDWKDPATDESKEGFDRLWKVTFIGALNLIMGVILFVVIKFSGVPVDVVPGLFMCVGGVFLVVGSYMGYKEGRLL